MSGVSMEKMHTILPTLTKVLFVWGRSGAGQRSLVDHYGFSSTAPPLVAPTTGREAHPRNQYAKYVGSEKLLRGVLPKIFEHFVCTISTVDQTLQVFDSNFSSNTIVRGGLAVHQKYTYVLRQHSVVESITLAYTHKG